MPLLLGLYGRQIDFYGKNLRPMFDALIERYELGPRVTALLLEGEGIKFQYPKYNHIRRAAAARRYSRIVTLEVYQKEAAEGILEVPDVVLGFGIKTIKSGFHVCVYIGNSSCEWPEVRSLLEFLPEERKRASGPTYRPSSGGDVVPAYERSF